MCLHGHILLKFALFISSVRSQCYLGDFFWFIKMAIDRLYSIESSTNCDVMILDIFFSCCLSSLVKLFRSNTSSYTYIYEHETACI